MKKGGWTKSSQRGWDFWGLTQQGITASNAKGVKKFCEPTGGESEGGVLFLGKQ